MLITVFAVYLYSPVIRSHAAETSRTLEVNAEITSMISMNSIPTTSITAARGEFNTTIVPVTVDTNSPYGYSLMMEDLDIESSLVNQASENHKITSTFSGAKTATTMDVNNWGYSMDGTNYYSIPTFGNAIRIKNTAAPTVTSDITSVGLGIKVGKALAAGTYVDYLLFTAITNGQDGNPYQAITRDMTMQGFDFKKAYGQTYMLTDTRNNKTYEVKSLMNGYWMLENLDLSNITINGADSGFDGSGDFTIPASSSSWTLSDGVPEVYTTNVAKYGTYYNFVAATADNSSNGYYTGSICPDGW